METKMRTNAAVKAGTSLLVLAFAVGIAGAGELKGTVKATGVRNSADAARRSNGARPPSRFIA